MAETEKNRVDSVIIMSPIGQFITSPVTFLHSVDPRIKLVWLLTLVVLPARANIVQKAIKDSAKRNDLVTAKGLSFSSFRLLSSLFTLDGDNRGDWCAEFVAADLKPKSTDFLSQTDLLCLPKLLWLFESIEIR